MELIQSPPGAVARPLQVLVPLIKSDLKQADDAAERARMPYMIAAGEKMLEAKPSFKGKTEEFHSWLRRSFNLSRQQAYRYMKLVPNETNDRSDRTIDPRGFASLNAYHKATGSPSYRDVTTKREWHDPVKEAIGKVNVDALKQEALKRQEERALQRKLALSLIDIGYKALATKLHPDKGGSREAMTRLNRVRDLLRSAVSS